VCTQLENLKKIEAVKEGGDGEVYGDPVKPCSVQHYFITNIRYNCLYLSFLLLTFSNLL
jgi:hypothetical protein